MEEREETVRARKDLAKDHLKKHWKRGMKQREARVLLIAHAKALSVPHMYQCVFDDDPDFLGDLLVLVAEEATDSVAALCEPLTAATLEENERSIRNAGSSVRDDVQSQQDNKSAHRNEQPADVPSYDDDDTVSRFLSFSEWEPATDKELP